MNRTSRLTVAALCIAALALPTAPALAKARDGGIGVEFEVDSNRARQRWNWSLAQNGTRIAAGTRTTARPSGSFSVERRTANRSGVIVFVGRAVNRATGEVCRGSLRFRTRLTHCYRWTPPPHRRAPAPARIADQESERDALVTATVLGESIVQPRLGGGILRGRSAAITDLDEALAGPLDSADVATVRLWRAGGTIIYSDEPRLVGERLDLASDEREALTTTCRVARGTLQNVAKHARAHHVSVTLTRTTAAGTLEVVDDGRGVRSGRCRRRPGPGGPVSPRAPRLTTDTRTLAPAPLGINGGVRSKRT